MFWFGKVTPNENYADVRVGYSSTELFVRLSVIDRLLWYKHDPAPEEIPDWDSASLFLDLDGNRGNAIGPRSYRFDSQLAWWEPRQNYQASYRGDGSNWNLASFSFTTRSGYRGNAPNDQIDDRGWITTFQIPFATMGLSGPPTADVMWGLGVILHDRDSAGGPPNRDTAWPQNLDPYQPVTWGELAFGLPEFSAQTGKAPEGQVTIRNKLNGAVVIDGMVGGSSNCGSGLDFWMDWGEANYAGLRYVNVQNQYDIADWPCFSKVYLTFPLESLPAGKTILSAKLTMFQFGNAGGGEWGPAFDSYIQALTLEDDWSELDLNWNNAPQAKQNLSGTWVKPVLVWPGYPGIPWTWDVSLAVEEAYGRSQPLRIVLYSADNEYNSGKYFTSSDAEDWNATARPTLEIAWGAP